MAFLFQNSKKDEDFEILARKICEFFPREKLEVYYIPPKSKKETEKKQEERRAGKLSDKYRNTVTYIQCLDNTVDVLAESESEQDDLGKFTSNIYFKQLVIKLFHF